MENLVTMLRVLTEDQAHWLVMRFKSVDEDADRIMMIAKANGQVYHHNFHLRYDEMSDTYDIIIRKAGP